jgi:hypothetical protein
MAGISIEKNGFISFTSLMRDIVSSMKNNGFNIRNVDGVLTNDTLSLSEKIILEPTVDIDGAFISQPWRVSIIFSEEGQWIDFYITGEDQVLDWRDDFRIANKRTTANNTWKAGKLVKDSLHQTEDGIVRSLSFEGWDIPNSDVEANPMSYRITITDHGFSLYIWVESYDSSGQKLFWLCTQRMVDYEGVPVITGKAPLVCVFANKGYPDTSTLSGDPDPDSVFKFIVRESDVNSPTFPISAVEDRADSSRIINIAEQVSLRENNSVVLYFPNNLNTQRYAYPHQLDMIGVISADVISQSTDLQIDIFGESEPRTYRAMNADQLDNKGARILFLVDSENIDRWN